MIHVKIHVGFTLEYVQVHVGTLMIHVNIHVGFTLEYVQVHVGTLMIHVKIHVGFTLAGWRKAALYLSFSVLTLHSCFSSCLRLETSVVQPLDDTGVMQGM
jgi:hypothetical protein